MKGAWVSVFRLACTMMLVQLMVKADMSMYEAIPDQACGVACSFTRTVRSLVDCMTTCDQGSSLCYNPEAAFCTCCSDTGVGSTCPAVQTTTECFQRHVVCPDGWTRVGDSCVVGQTGESNFESCKSVCKSSGARILTLYSQTEADVVNPFLGSNSGPSGLIWLGVITNSSISGNRPWYYSDTGELITYSKWIPSALDFYGTDENCVAMIGLFGFHWFDVSCGWNATCICQM